MQFDPRVFPPRPPLLGESDLSAGIEANCGDDLRRWNSLPAKVTAPTAGSTVEDASADADRLRRIFGDQCLAHNDDLSAGIWDSTAQVKSGGRDAKTG